jgi:VWFA-related protein
MRHLVFASLLFAGLSLVPVARAQQAAAPPAGAQAPTGQAPQTPPLTFRIETNYVEADVLVTDAAGKFVPSLNHDDFDVLEDGKPQNVSVFSLVDIPIEHADPPLFREKPIDPDVTSNEKPFDGRVYMFVLDSFHVSPQRSITVRQEAHRFVDQFLGANDIAAVIHIGNPSAGQEFTANKRLLNASIDQFTGGALESVTKSINDDAKAKSLMKSPGFDPGPPGDPDAPTRAFMARQTMDSVRRLSEFLGGLSGRRKALLFFSEGIEYDTDEHPADEMYGKALLVRDADAVRSAQTEMLSAATRNNVNIYSVNPRGLAAGNEDAIFVGTISSDPEYAPTTPISIGTADELRRAQETLRTFSDETGGRALVDKNDMDAAFRSVVEDNSAYYVLGYQSPDTFRDGKYHRISVRLKKPGLTVRTRSGYYSPSDHSVKVAAKLAAPADPITALLTSPAPVSGLGMRVNATAAKGVPAPPPARGVVSSKTAPKLAPVNLAKVHLTVEFNGKDIAYREENGLANADVAVEFQAIDMNGTSRAHQRQIVHLHLKPDTHRDVDVHGVRYSTDFDIEPGRYQLRVGARDEVNGLTGSVYSDLNVPDFSKGSMAMSDLLMSSTTADKILTGKGGTNFTVSGGASTVRAFRTDETLTASTGIYVNDKARAFTIDLKAGVFADDGRQVFSREDHRESQDIARDPAGYEYQVSVPLTALAPGRYVLSVSAVSRLGGAPVTRETEFVIR